MKKIFLIYLCLFPIIGYSEEPVEISIDEKIEHNDTQRNQTKVKFTAELYSDGTIIVHSSEITSFNVKIYNEATPVLLYQGSTINGKLHISSTSLQAGHYILQIETAETLYSGNFEISELN